MKDLTAVLMGDPAATYRRAPTERERLGMKAATSHEQKRNARKNTDTFDWPVGVERIYTSWRKARNAQSTLYAKQMQGILRTRKDGTVSVRRVQ